VCPDYPMRCVRCEFVRIVLLYLYVVVVATWETRAILDIYFLYPLRIMPLKVAYGC
jgi:hypothetical protein